MEYYFGLAKVKPLDAKIRETKDAVSEKESLDRRRPSRMDVRYRFLLCFHKIFNIK